MYMTPQMSHFAGTIASTIAGTTNAGDSRGTEWENTISEPPKGGATQFGTSKNLYFLNVG